MTLTPGYFSCPCGWHGSLLELLKIAKTGNVCPACRVAGKVGPDLRASQPTPTPQRVAVAAKPDPVVLPPKFRIDALPKGDDAVLEIETNSVCLFIDLSAATAERLAIRLLEAVRKA